MELIKESRSFINKYGGNIPAQQHVLGLYDDGNIKTYEIFHKMIKPGNLYTFKYYDKKAPFDLVKNKIPYCDLNPYGLVLSKTSTEIRMINLNIIPIKAREKLFQLMEKFYRQLIAHNTNNSIVHSWKAIPITEEIIKKYIPYDLSIAINIYNTKYIQKVYAFDWSNVYMLMSLYFEKKIFFNKLNRINKKLLYFKILMNRRKEKLIKK